MNTPEQSRLGKSSTYSDQYDASLLFPIPRAAKRAEIAVGDKPPFLGADLWTSHELSWLNLRGKPQVALAHFTVPCETPSIAGCGEITPRMLVCIVRNACRAPNGAKEAPTFEITTTPNLKQNSALELINLIKP